MNINRKHEAFLAQCGRSYSDDIVNDGRLNAAVQKAGRALGSRHELYFAAIAKSRAGEAPTEVATMSHQCHGAMGYTWEYPLHRCTSRALAWRDDAGSEQYWNERIGRAALASGAGELWPLLLEGASI